MIDPYAAVVQLVPVQERIPVHGHKREGEISGTPETAPDALIGEIVR